VSEEWGVLPEGIEVTPAGRMYVTSSATGDVHVGSVGSATMSTFARGSDVGRASALGVHADARGRVFVASPSGVDVYSPGGELLARRGVASGEVASTYLNDLVITSDAVYVTDSANALVWRMGLQGNAIGELRPWLRARELMPSFEPGWFYLNGIVASPDGSGLLVSAQGLGALIRVDTESADAEFVVTDGSAFGNFGPDGMVLDGDVVRGVLNYGAPAAGQGLYVARLDPEWRTASVVAATTDAGFSTPTTVAASGDRYLVVNSQLDTAPGNPPWTVVAVPDPLG
jgi:sugar lactone lactonase YvrE